MSTLPGFYTNAYLIAHSSWFKFFKQEVDNRQNLFGEKSEKELAVIHPELTEKDFKWLQRWRAQQLLMAENTNQLLNQKKIYKISMLDKALHEMPQWDTPQQYWLQGCNIKLPVQQNQIVLIDFALTEPCSINLGETSVVLWGALVYKPDANSTFIQPLGGQHMHSGFFCYLPTLCTKISGRTPNFVMQRTPGDGEFGLLSNPNAIMMAKWTGLGMAEFVISFLYNGSTVLLNQ